MAHDQPRSPENKSGYSVDDLTALVEQGPLWDGDVPSKSGRDQLIEHGYAVRVVVKGEDGYTAATARGRDLYCACWGECATLKEAMAYRQSHTAILRAQQHKRE